MNQFLSGILLILALLLIHSEAELMQRYYQHAEHPGKCTINPVVILNPGEFTKHPHMECARIVCGQNGVAEIQSCGAEISLFQCKLGDRKFPKADYPICCPRNHVCPRQQVEDSVVDLDI